MQIPEGFFDYSTIGRKYLTSTDIVLELHKTIYGVVQAARAFNEELSKCLEGETIKMQRSRADPCLYYRSNAKGIVFFIVYVDDCLLTGDQAAIDDILFHMSKPKGPFKLTQDEHVAGYTGCSFEYCTSGIKIHQPALIKTLEKMIPHNISEFHTPAPPGQILQKSTDDGTPLSSDDMVLYRSGTGKALYFVKISRPDISNATRELSKFMDNATTTHFKQMQRLLKYIMHTKDKGLLIKKSSQGPLTIQGYSDSNYANDKDTRQSVTGYVIYVNETLVAWKSKMQPGVTLSSTEAEYVALSMCLSEMLFIKQVLESIYIPINLPMTLFCDNTGAIGLCHNYATTGRTRHVDIRWHFIREHIEKKNVQVIYKNTQDNRADPMTKNVSHTIFQRHETDLVYS